MAYSDGSYRLVVGWVNQTQIDASNDITKFPKQTGQGRQRWLQPLDSDHFNQAESIEKSLSRDGKRIGDSNFKWSLGGLLPCMAAYWQNTVFSGKPTGRFTVMTWDPSTDSWPLLWVTAEWGIAENVGERGYRRGYRRYVVDFVTEKAAPAGPDVAPVVNRSGDLAAPATLTYSLQIENRGDGATYEDVLIQVDLPTGVVYSNDTGDDWAVEYYEGSSWNSSVTVPADVEAVRATYNGALDADETTTALDLEVTIASVDSYDLTITATTTGDTDNGNDQVIDTVVTT